MRKRLLTLLLAVCLAAFCGVQTAAEQIDRSIIALRQNRFYFDKEVEGETAEDEAWEFTFQMFPDATFTVDTRGQADLTLGVDDYPDDLLEAAYPQARLIFFNGDCERFQKHGLLFLPAEPGSALYRNINRTLYDISAEYNEQDGGFWLRTKSINRYVIADAPLPDVQSIESFLAA